MRNDDGDTKRGEAAGLEPEPVHVLGPRLAWRSCWCWCCSHSRRNESSLESYFPTLTQVCCFYFCCCCSCLYLFLLLIPVMSPRSWSGLLLLLLLQLVVVVVVVQKLLLPLLPLLPLLLLLLNFPLHPLRFFSTLRTGGSFGIRKGPLGTAALPAGCRREGDARACELAEGGRGVVERAG
jgi:hypothetical protein